MQTVLSFAGTLVRSLINTRKRVPEPAALAAARPVVRSGTLTPSSGHLERFCKAVQWKEKSIPPTYPYALATALQFDIVNDSEFPFSPYGILHKSEKIEVLRPLTLPQTSKGWVLNCRIDRYTEVKRGYEFELKSELLIDGILSWKSTTTAFKRMKAPEPSERKKVEAVDASSGRPWSFHSGLGRVYGVLSKNLDPIHVSGITAKLLGHPAAIIHGMYTLARGLSEVPNLAAPITIETRFYSPVFLPAKLCFVPDTNSKGFKVVSRSGAKTHIQVEISSA